MRTVCVVNLFDKYSEIFKSLYPGIAIPILVGAISGASFIRVASGIDVETEEHLHSGG